MARRPTASAAVPNGLDNGEPSNAHAPNSNSSIDILGRHVKKLMSTINSLETLGISKEMPLPKIVVVGDQSAGKSSQVEALSDIKVPRADGACTRCVLHISLKTSDTPQWSCKVSIIRNYDWNGRKNSLVKSREELGPWSLMEKPAVTTFALLTKKSDLELAMKRAQLALLHPSREPSDFTQVDVSRYIKYQTNFSPNVVHLEISAPDLPNLSFYDLPGMIQQSEEEGESYLPPLIKTLAEIYIQEEHTIVMLARPMTADASTSTSGRLVEELKARDRTIGVLTKPDRLANGQVYTQWERLISGEPGPMAVGHGYYVTRQPSQQELDASISQQEARVKESEFFANTPPWCNTFAKYKEKFGTSNLRNKLSVLLAREISQALPAIRTTLYEKLSAIEARLEELPKPQADNSHAIISQLVEKFRSDMQSGLAGDSYNHFTAEDDDTIVSSWKRSVETLRKTIRETRPAIVIRDEEPESQWESRVINSRDDPIDVDADDAEPAPTPSRKRGAQNAAHPSTPSKKQRTGASATPTARTSLSQVKKDVASDANEGPTDQGVIFKLRKLRDELQRKTASTIADEVDSKAKESLMIRSMAHWDKSVDDYIAKTLNLLNHLVQYCLNVHLKMHTSTLLDIEMRKAAGDFLTTLGEDFRVHIRQALAVERHKPTTFNGEIRRFYQEKEFSFISQQRRLKRATQFIAYTERRDEKSDEVKNRGEKLAKDEARYATLGEDPFRREIEIIADIRAYYFVAADCFVDTIAKLTEYHLFRTCNTDLSKELAAALKINSARGFEHAKVLLAEDTAREAERFALQEQKLRLLKAQALLQNIGTEDDEGGVVSLEEPPADDDVA